MGKMKNMNRGRKRNLIRRSKAIFRSFQLFFCLIIFLLCLCPPAKAGAIFFEDFITVPMDLTEWFVKCKAVDFNPPDYLYLPGYVPQVSQTAPSIMSIRTVGGGVKRGGICTVPHVSDVGSTLPMGIEMKFQPKGASGGLAELWLWDSTTNYVRMTAWANGTVDLTLRNTYGEWTYTSSPNIVFQPDEWLIFRIDAYPNDTGFYLLDENRNFRWGIVIGGGNSSLNYFVGDFELVIGQWIGGVPDTVSAVSDVDYVMATTSHIIQADVDINNPYGSISPNGQVLVDDGLNQTFTITPHTGYHVTDVVVDSVPLGPISSYTFTDVTSDHTITASFAIGMGDDFSGNIIDRTKWADLEVFRRINNGVLESELRRYGANGSNYLRFNDPSTVNSFQADVTIKDYQNNGSYPHGSLLGYAYKGKYDSVPGDVPGDVLGVVGIGHNPTKNRLEGFWSISRCTTANCNLPDEYDQICTGSFDSDLGVPLPNTSYRLYFSWNRDPTPTFTFGIGNRTRVISSSNCSDSGLPTYVGPPDVDTKGIGTRVSEINNSNEWGYIAATFDNVYVNDSRPPVGPSYDNFDSSNMIDVGKWWGTLELVRMVDNGELVSELTQRGVNGSNSTNFVNSEQILGFEADLKVVEFQSSGARPLARLFASLYNDGTRNNIPGDLKGDVIASVGISGQGTTPQAFYAVARCLAPNCNLETTEYEFLSRGTFPVTVALNEPHRFSISWDGVNVALGCDGDVISYNPTSLVPIPVPPKDRPKGRKGIGTRVNEIGPPNEWAYVSARFDNVVITEVDSDLDGLPDSWEIANFGNLSQGALGDPDGDGLTNLQEFRLGTNPMLTTPTITSITPNYDTTNNSALLFTLLGTGFVSGATVQLTNFLLIDPDLPNPGSIDATGVTGGGTSITGTFNLTGAPVGQYNVVVTNPNGESAILSKGFTVLDTNPPVTTANPRGATYNTPLSVTLQANEPATIYYYDEIEQDFVEYTEPINISSNTTLQFYAVDAAGNKEADKTEFYTIDTEFEAIAVLDSPTPELIMPVTLTFTFPPGTQAVVVDCQKVNLILRDSAGNVLPRRDYLKHYVIGPPDTPGSDVKIYSGPVSVTCDLAKLYPSEVLVAGNNTLEFNYSHFFKPQGSQVFTGSISGDPIPVPITEAITTHIIMTEAEPGGSILLFGSGVSGPVVVRDASEPTFTIRPNPGYYIADVKVDDVSQGATSSYTFPPVTADHTISATFAANAGNILVKAVKLTIGIGNYPLITTSPVVGMPVRAFTKSAGSCAGQYGIISWPHYKDIWNNCPSVAQGVTNASGEASLSVRRGTYIVIGRYESNTSDPNDDIYVADNILNIQANQTRQARLYVITVATGEHLPCKYSEHTGSSLFAIEPEYVEWSGTEELYPFVFDGMGNWDVSVSVVPPEGFVADHNTLSSDVNSDLKSVQFTINDIGSKWVSTGVNYEIKHKGKIKKIKSKIGIKLSKELAKKKGLSEYGHEEPRKSNKK